MQPMTGAVTLWSSYLIPSKHLHSIGMRLLFVCTVLLVIFLLNVIEAEGRRGGGHYSPWNNGQVGRRFENRENRLPRQQRVKYLEYDLGSNNGGRGARRVVVGADDEGRVVSKYKTDDHYKTFQRLE